MKRPSTPVAAELWDQLCFLSDPKVRWLRKMPNHALQACLVYRVGSSRWDDDHILSKKAIDLLRVLISTELDYRHYFVPVTSWNDHHKGVNRQTVIWVLEEAVEWAIEEEL